MRLSLRAEQRDALPQRFGRQAERLPAISEPRRTSDGGAADATDHHGDGRLLEWLGRELHSGEAVVLAVEARLVFGPQRAHDSDGLVGESAPLRERAPPRANFLLDEPHADTQDQP